MFAVVSVKAQTLIRFFPQGVAGPSGSVGPKGEQVKSDYHSNFDSHFSAMTEKKIYLTNHLFTAMTL